MPAQRDTRRVIVLGSTGSIGTQTLEVIEHLNGLHARGEFATRFEVVGLAARKNSALLDQQAERFGVRETALADASPAGPEVAGYEVSERSLLGKLRYRARVGHDSGVSMIRQVDCDLVVAAMSGAAGLPATLAAVELGRDVALANKETLVAAGSLIVPAAKASGSRLLPVDSEHSAVWQYLSGLGDAGAGLAPPMCLGDRVSRIILTASGGPFRAWSREAIAAATPDQALKHPTWSMGPKVTVDSASLTNKALEIIEAHWLFGLPASKIAAVIHPQSIIHAIVEMADGSAVAQLGAPDMRGPIQHALTFPGRAPGLSRRLNWSELRALEFEEPDHDRFPALRLAYRAIEQGGTAGAVLNAANEAAVEAFLARRIPFGRITELTALAMDRIAPVPIVSLQDVQRADAQARELVRAQLPA
jgi:1-deoxy-D-xylulose-5-phosphate reductoisomerase